MALDYSFYTNTYLGNSISAADFPRLSKRAKAKYDYYCRIYTVTSGDDTSTNMAICAMADALYYFECAGNGDFVKSSSIGSVSTSFGGNIDISPKAQSKELLDCMKLYVTVYRGAGNACC